MMPSNSISLNSPAGDLLRAFSKDAEFIGFLQSSDYCYCLLVDRIPFYVFRQMNDTFVTRILYGTPFRSEAERQSAESKTAEETEQPQDDSQHTRDEESEQPQDECDEKTDGEEGE